jgi:hypothetical protein
MEKININACWLLPLKIYLTFAAKSFPVLNFTTLRAGILSDFPVLGLRPFRAERFETRKVPNPTRTSLSPFFNVDMVVFMNASIAELACVFEIFASLAIFAISSPLFMVKI